MNLYEISSEIERITDLIDRTQGDEALMTQEDRDAMAAFVEGLRTEADIKADGYARSIREHESRAECRRLESRRMAELAAADECRADSVRRFLMACMERAGMSEMKGKTFTLAIQKNGGLPPVSFVGDAESLPERFRKVTYSVDKAAIVRALQQGDKEAATFACLGERGRTLRIK